MAKKFKKVKDKKSDLVFVGCLFLGLGTGMYFGNVAVGVLIGLGVGFITKAILMKK